MELQFPDGVDIAFGSNCEFELPNYICKLPVDEFEAAKKMEGRDNLVIAAGTDPRDKKITLLTATGKILVFDAPKYYIPDGPSLPSHGGTKVFLPNIKGRWAGQSPGFYVDSSWMISKSQSALTGATLQANYRGENNSNSTKKVDT